MTDRQSTRRAIAAVVLAAGLQSSVARSSPVEVEVVPRLDEVRVTAWRREELAQRAPLSVVALGAEELARRSISNLRDLQNFVPNLTLAPSQNVGDAAANVFIRGIGQEDFVPGAEPGVALYVDGAYVGRAMGMLRELIDVERIEVLRGPQGTLYGKNAIGGAINLISHQPTHNLQRDATVVYGNLGRFDARAVVNAPVSPTLFVRAAVSSAARDGYVRRLPVALPPATVTETDFRPEGSVDSLGARIQLRWEANEWFTADLSADASRRRGTQGATHVDAIDPQQGNLPTINRLIRSGALPGPVIDQALVTTDLLSSRAAGSSWIAHDVAGVALTARIDLGRHVVKALAARRELRSRVATDLDGLYFAISENQFAERSHETSFELQSSGELDSLRYVGGVFVLRERLVPLPVTEARDVLYDCLCLYTPTNRPLRTAAERRLKGDSAAAYAQLNVPLGARLTATLGGRFSHESKSIAARLVRLDPDTLQLTDTTIATGNQRGRWNSSTWRAGIENQVTDDWMIYVSGAKGYKSGGFNVRLNERLPNLGLTSFAPESALTWEAGIRSEWFGQRLRFNLTAFHTSYRDIQLRQQTLVDGIATTLIENASRARIRGIETELAARLTRRFAMRLSAGLIDARYVDVGRVPGLTLGTEFQRTPRTSLAIAADYSVPLARGSIVAHADFTHRSREQFQLTPTPWDQAAYGLVGARVGWHSPDDRLALSLFATNLADERFRTAGRGTVLSLTGIAYSSIGLPRQVGMELKWSY